MRRNLRLINTKPTPGGYTGGEGKEMQFTITLPKKSNFTPLDLMLRYSKSNNRFICTYDSFMKVCLYDQQTEKIYYYDHWKIKSNSDDTESVTVYLIEKE